MATILEIDGLKAYYIIREKMQGRESYVYAVDDVSLQIYDNEVLGIAGESGCGKSTLVKVLYGFVEPPLIVVDGKAFYRSDAEMIDLLSLDASSLRNKIFWRVFSYVPQGSMSVLSPTMRIKNIFLDIIHTHNKDIDKKEAMELISKHLQEVGLPSEVLSSYPHQLSGGMRQRVVIALATILKPKIIFADEPTTALDVVVQRGIIQLLKKVHRETRNTLVLVSHDMGLQAQLTDRVAIMYAGKIVEVAPTKDIFRNPINPYTQYLIMSLPKIGDKSRRVSISGRPPSLRNPPRGCRFHPRCPYKTKACEETPPKLIRVENDHYVACNRVNR